MTAPSPLCARCSGAGWVWLSVEVPAGPRAVEASCPDCCAPLAQVIAGWREAHHWSPQARSCRHCGAPTHLRDGDGAPAHKVCNEQAIHGALGVAPAGVGGAR